MAHLGRRQKVILDVDPGHDDVVNMLLALASPEVEVLGFTVVFGNVGLERTTRNALVTREVSTLRFDSRETERSEKQKKYEEAGMEQFRCFSENA